MRFKNVIVGPVMFLGGLFLGGLLLNQIHTTEMDSVVGVKLAFYKTHEEEIDTLFAGTSRVHHQINPVVFDTCMKEKGQATKSFNMGVYGMINHEMERFLRTSLKGHKKLRYIFIEVTYEPPNLVFPLTRRAIWWHNLPETARIAGDILVYHGALKNKALSLWAHLKHFALNVFQLGNGANLWQKPVPLSAYDLTETVQTKGYNPISSTPINREAYDKRRQTLLNARDSWEARRDYLKSLSGKTFVPREISPEQWSTIRYLNRLVSFLETKSDHIILFTAPGNGFRFPNLKEFLKSQKVDYYEFNDPVVYPGFYDFENWGDISHINDNLSDQFSCLLAHHVCESPDRKAP